MTYRQGKEDMRDDVLAIIIGLQNGIGNKDSERYAALQDVAKAIIKMYGGMFEPLREESK